MVYGTYNELVTGAGWHYSAGWWELSWQAPDWSDSKESLRSRPRSPERAGQVPGVGWSLWKDMGISETGYLLTSCVHFDRGHDDWSWLIGGFEDNYINYP